MEHTFMTIHNLTPEANVLFASESIADILGYHPSEVQGKSCFDYFHPEEIPFARHIHSRGVELDKAAVLHYARILSRDGRWIGCECCFTIVHDVLVACVSVYKRGAKSTRRAIEAPQIRRIFSCSPRDPRYHMLEHLSPKFRMPAMEREPRAALIVNRFTRNLTVMFATNAITAILGLRPDQIKGKNFYSCIQDSCLSEAVKCLESAKANDSIAYLRFSFQDPRDDDEIEEDANSEAGFHELEAEHEEERYRREQSRKDDPDDAASCMDIDSDDAVRVKTEDEGADFSLSGVPLCPPQLSSRAESVGSTASAATTTAASTTATAPTRRLNRLPSIELEAVVSCTSDGLVVVLRKARPPIPPAHPPLVPFNYGNGLFAAPWAQQPIHPHFPIENICAFRPPLLPQYMPLHENVKNAGGPPIDALMGSIREVAVFAWGVVGINPAMAEYGRGLPSGDAKPNEEEQRELQLQEQQLDRQAREQPYPRQHGQRPPLARYGESHAIVNSPTCASLPLPGSLEKGKAPEYGASFATAFARDKSSPRLMSSNDLVDPPPATFSAACHPYNAQPPWATQTVQAAHAAQAAQAAQVAAQATRARGYSPCFDAFSGTTATTTANMMSGTPPELPSPHLAYQRVLHPDARPTSPNLSFYEPRGRHMVSASHPVRQDPHLLAARVVSQHCEPDP